MALTKTPICDFGKKAENFNLKSINNELVSLEKIKGVNFLTPFFLYYMYGNLRNQKYN